MGGRGGGRGACLHTSETGFMLRVPGPGKLSLLKVKTLDF